MRKYVFLGIFTTIALVFTAYIPNLMKSTIPQVEITKPINDVLETSINCTGKVEETKRQEVQHSLPLIPSSVGVSTGDKVEEGEILFEVDVERTSTLYLENRQALLNNQDLLQGLSEYATATYGGLSESLINIPEVISAPCSGVVTKVNVTPGQLTEPNKALVIVSGLNELQVKAQVSEASIYDVKVGQKAIVTGTGFGGKSYSGTVKRISPTAYQSFNGSTNEVVVDVYIVIENPNQTIKPGFSAKVKILTNESEKALILPYEAITQEDEGNEYVFVFSGNKAIKRYIKTGREMEKGIEVVEGITEEDRIILYPDKIKNNKSKLVSVKN